jgi:hypothetical protein
MFINKCLFHTLSVTVFLRFQCGLQHNSAAVCSLWGALEMQATHVWVGMLTEQGMFVRMNTSCYIGNRTD